MFTDLITNSTRLQTQPVRPELDRVSAQRACNINAPISTNKNRNAARNGAPGTSAVWHRPLRKSATDVINHLEASRRKHWKAAKTTLRDICSKQNCDVVTNEKMPQFFFCRVLHTMVSYLRAHAFARSRHCGQVVSRTVERRDCAAHEALPRLQSASSWSVMEQLVSGVCRLSCAFHAAGNIPSDVRMGDIGQ